MQRGEKAYRDHKRSSRSVRRKRVPLVGRHIFGIPPTEENMTSESPYHWRDLAADERKADQIRELLKMPNLEFESVLDVMCAEVQDPPTVEVQDQLKRLKCELTTTPLLGTRIDFKRSRHVADVVIRVLDLVRYALMALCAAMFVEMMRSARQSEFFTMF